MKHYLKGKGKLFTWGGIIAVVLIMVFVLSSILMNTEDSQCAVYIKDKELFYTSTEAEPWQVTEQFVASNSMDNKSLAEVSSLLNSNVKFSRNGKKIFYIENMNSEDGMSIYYRTVNEEGTPQKIASGIQSFELNDKGTLVTYLKSKNGELYQHNLQDAQKIASDVEKYFVSRDGEEIVYKKVNGDIYRQSEKYGKQKIATGVKTLIHVYESGKMYYIKEETQARKAADYVEDDMKKEDDKLITPQAPESPFMWQYDSKEEYQKASEKYLEEYNSYKKEKEAYEAKLNRDILRNKMKTEKVDISLSQLCYYNGNKEIVITENATGWRTYAKENEALIYSACEVATAEKMKISQLSSYVTAKEKVEEFLKAETGYYLAVGTKISEIEQENAKYISIDDAGKTIYMIDHVLENKEEGELYKIKVSNKKARKPKKVDDGVYVYSASFQEDSYVYYKDVQTEKKCGDLYMDGKWVDSDVRMGTVRCEGKSIAYISEWNADRKCGILKTYTTRMPVTVHSEVVNYVFLTSGEIVYLCDYDGEKYTGKLSIYDGNESRKVDDEVVSLIDVNVQK